MKKATALNNQPLTDWHSADIKAALEKAGWSLSRLSLAAGYSNRNTLTRAMNQPWPLGERVIAHALGLEPWEVWPSRYTNGTPNRGRTPKNDAKWHSIKAQLECNANDNRAV